jgi:hypothetical protein
MILLHPIQISLIYLKGLPGTVPVSAALGPQTQLFAGEARFRKAAFFQLPDFILKTGIAGTARYNFRSGSKQVG